MTASSACLSIVLILAVVLAGCRERQGQLHYGLVATSEKFEPATQISLLHTLDPVTYAQAEFRRGDRKLLAIGGLVVFIPCIENRADLRNAVGFKIITGTGEGASSDFQSLAERFAFGYNMELLRLQTNQ